MADRTRTERLLTFLMLPAIIVAVVVLIAVTFRTSFQLEKLREQSVVEASLSLANEKADRLDKLIIEQDNAVANEVDIRNLESLKTDWLDIAARQTPTVRAVLVVLLRRPLRDVIAFVSRAPGPEDEQFRRLLMQSMIGDMKLKGVPNEQLQHLHKNYRGKDYLLSYWLRENEGRRYLVVAWHDVPRVVHEVLPTLYSERDRQSRVNIVDAQGRIVFGPPLSGGEFTVGRPFETTLYKWRLNVALSSAEQLAANVERRRRLEMMLVGLAGAVVVAGMLVILVAVARQRRLSNLKGEFVANVTHELKTPLSLVRMFSELLQSGRVDSDAKRQQYLGIIVDETDRLSALIDNVLDFARLERGKSAYRLQPGLAGEVVARAVDACMPRFEREQKALLVDVAADLPRSELDEGAVEIAVINLVDNALKYAPDGEEVSVTVRQEKRSIVVRVTDQGPGIPMDERKRVFERFVRGQSAQERKTRGSGIGLALVKQIAEAHGGRAWIEAPPNGGAIFAFSLGRLLDGET